MKIANLILMTTALVAMSCGSKKEAAQTAPTVATPVQVQAPQQKAISGVIPKAVVYKMTGNADRFNVPVQVSPNDTGKIVSFPAPSDVRGQEPIEMADGYLLDRRGINPNTVFTKWTYAEYGALTSTPTIAEIKAAIIPGARPVSIHVLPMTLTQALADTAAVNNIIRKF